MATTAAWQVAGSYFEVCNCEAICPCRRQGGTAGGSATYPTCDFALSWLVQAGHYHGLDLSGLGVVLVGSFQPKHPWQVALFVDQHATGAQHQAIANIFLGRAGGDPAGNYARAIADITEVRSARIVLDHRPGRESLAVEDLVSAATAELVPSEVPVSCGIPGHHRPGQEIRAGRFRVTVPPFDWDLTGRCGFATTFEYLPAR